MDNLEKMLAALRKEVADIDGPDDLPTRSLIEGLVMRGQITREQADELARDCDEPPFEERPDPGDFEPKDATEWTIAMALEWINSKTPEAVRSVWEDYLSKCWVWKSYNAIEAWEKAPGGSRKVVGHKLEQPVTPHPSQMSTPDAKRQLLMTALRKGDLKAYSERNADPIANREWEVLSPFTLLTPSYRQIHHDAVFDDNGTLQFRRVRVKSVDVMRLWPEEPVAAPISAEAPAEEAEPPKDKPLTANKWKTVLRDKEKLLTLVTNPAMPAGLSRVAYKAEAVRRNGGGLVDQSTIFSLHRDPAVYPGRPGFGPRKGPRKSSQKFEKSS